MRLAAACLLSCLVVESAAAQNDPGRTSDPKTNPIDYATVHLDRIVDALRIDEKIQLDGLLNESAWERAKPAANFTQWEPRPGQPATEPTEVRFLYDDDNLYVGALCFDSDPDGIIVNELKEDFAGQEGDGLTLFIDSIDDDRSGLLFATNPAGARRDSEVFNDGDQNNQDWDGVWDVRARITDKGWVAEFVIPLKTLRFKNPPSHQWGLNMTRRVRRLNEDSHWSPLPRRYRVFKTSLAGTLRGFEELEQGRDLRLKPYVTAGPSQVYSSGVLNTHTDRDAGVDFKYGLTPSLRLDLTYRTDFSQVEADQQQVNLTRFSVFFPEKREFFLENRDLFNFGVRGGGSGGGANNLLPFFSRQIGLSASGTPIPIVAGARVSGRVRTYDMGLLAMRTERLGATPANSFLVGRFKKNLFTNSWIGVIATSRSSTVTGDHNRVGGVDSNIQLFQKLDVTSYWLRSQTPALSGADQAKSVDISWRDNNFTLNGQYEQVQPNFNPEIGFIRRRDNEHYASGFTVLPRISNRYIRNFTFNGSMDYYAKWRGPVETRQQDGGGGMLFHNSSTMNYKVTHYWDRLEKPFGIRSDVSIPVGDYAYTRQEVNFNLDRSRKIAGGGNVVWGGFWDGDETSVGATLDLKPSYRLNIETTYTLNQVKLPSGNFTTHLLANRTLYSFSTKVFLNSFVQYNADTHQVSSNIRFNVLYRPLSDVFVVFNDRRDAQSGQLLERALIFKITNLISF